MENQTPDNSLLFEPKTLPPQQRAILFDVYAEFRGDVDEEMKLLKKLDSVFRGNVEMAKEHADTYFLIYTDLCWRRFPYLKEDMVPHVVAETLPCVLFIGYDAIDSFFTYLQNQYPNKDIVEQVFKETVAQCKQSQATVGYSRNGDLTLHNIFEEVSASENIDLGEILKKHQDSFVPLYTNVQSGLVTIDPTIVLTRILDVVSFFHQFPEGEIMNFVESYGNLGETLFKEQHEALIDPLKELPADLLPKVDNEEEVLQDVATASESTVSPFSPDSLLLGSTESLRGTIEWLKTFESPKIAWNALNEQLHSLVKELDFDSANAIMQLTFFLKQNGYASEPDIVYYDQESNSFHWNQ